VIFSLWSGSKAITVTIQVVTCSGFNIQTLNIFLVSHWINEVGLNDVWF